MLDRLTKDYLIDRGKLLLLSFIILFAATDIALSETAPLQDAVPTRYTLSVKDVEEAISDALEQQGAGEQIRATVIGKFGETLHSAAHPLVIEIRELTFDDAQQRWESGLIVFEEGEMVSTIPVSGRYDALVQVPVLTRRLHSGDVIAAEDVVWQLEPEHRLRKGTVQSSRDLIGKTPRRVISEKRPIRDSEIVAPVVMAKGAMVQLQFKTANMEIRTTGQALTDGSMGELIRIRNNDSNLVIQALVTGPNSAEVNPLANQLASAGQ